MLEFPDWIPPNIHGYFLLFDVTDKGTKLIFRSDYVPIQLLKKSHKNRLFWDRVVNKIDEDNYLFFIKCVEDSYYIANKKPYKKSDIKYYKSLKKTLSQLIPLLEDKRLSGGGSFDFDRYVQSVVLKNTVLSEGFASKAPYGLEDKVRDREKILNDTVFNVNQLSFMIDLELIKISNQERLAYANLSAPAIFCKLLYFEVEDFIDNPVSLITHALNIVFFNKKPTGWDTSYVSNIIRKIRDF